MSSLTGWRSIHWIRIIRKCMLIRKSSKKVANQNNVLTNEDTKILYENISSKSYVVNEKLRNEGSYLMKKRKWLIGLMKH